MKTIELTVSAPKQGIKDHAYKLDVPENLKEAEVWAGGEDKVYDIFLAKAVILNQDRKRAALNAGKTPEEADALVPQDWKPTMAIRIAGAKPVSTDAAIDKLAADIQAAKSPEERQDIIDKLMARAKEAKKAAKG